MGKCKPPLRMTNTDRAKQFAPFAALKGFETALREQEKIREEKKEPSDAMTESINSVLVSLYKGCKVKVLYYEASEMIYNEISGTVLKIDANRQNLYVDSIKIAFGDIYEIQIAETASRRK